jgi:hypothetical protein
VLREHDTSVVRLRPGAELVCDGVVSLQRGVPVVVDGGRLTIGHGTVANGLGTVVAGVPARVVGRADS